MRLSDKIGTYFGMKDLEERAIGIEIEMEATSRFPAGQKTEYYWEREHDGSLRGEYNTEYVLNNPMKKIRAFKALRKLDLMLKECGTQVVDSVRAGTHIHINVRDLSFKEMWTMTTCWYVLEELLTSTLCGKDRIGNHFCLCAQDADAVLFKVKDALQGQGIRKLAKDDVRYSALNFVALVKYGSLEFRAMRTPKDFDKIKVWIDVLLAIKENSKLFPNPRRVVENFSLGGERNFLKAILGNENAEMVIGCDPEGWRGKLRRGVRVAQEVAYAKDDWDKVEDVEEEIEINMAKLKDMEIRKFARMFQVEINPIENRVQIQWKVPVHE